MISAEPEAPAPKRILIVEDNDLNMRLLTDVLEAHGYSVDLTDAAHPDDPALNLGRVFFGEMIVGDEMKRLNMIRWDLGCDTCGGGSGGGADMNGLPMP